MTVENAKKISWVTGAYGFIGRKLAKALSQQGFRVFGVGHGHWAAIEYQSAGIEFWLGGDVSSSNLHFLYQKYGRPEVIYHLAGGSSVSNAFQSPLEDFRRTAGGTAELLDWTRQESNETRVVVSSSAAVYGNAYTQPIRESQSATPCSIYGYNKLNMETLCRSYGFNYGVKTVLARIFSVYGAGLKKQLIWDVCSKLDVQSPIIRLGGTGNEVRDWVHVDEAVSALIKLASQASESAPAINISTGKGTTVREIAECIIRNWDSAPGPQRKLEFDGKVRTGDPVYLVGDSSALEGLGIKLKQDIDPGIRGFVKWFRGRNYGA